MKSPEELKSSQVSMRMTEGQYAAVEKKAAEQNMTVSEFILDATVHRDNPINPYQLLQIQNLANLAADVYEASDPQTANRIREEASALWSLLK